MHEISKPMKIFQVFMFQRAKEMVLRHEARVSFPSRLLVEVAWNTVYFTGCWVECGQSGTNLRFTHSQLNTWLCTRWWTLNINSNITTLWNKCFYQGWVWGLLMEFIVSVCVRLCVCEEVAALVDNCAWEQSVCNSMCKQVFMHMWAITDGWFYSADYVILFTSKNFSHS